MLSSHDVSIDFNAHNVYNINAQVVKPQRKLRQWAPQFLKEMKALGIEMPKSFMYEDELDDE